MTSLDAAQATLEQFAGLVRSHWDRGPGPLPRDVIFGEDRQAAYIGHGPHMMAILRNLVLSLFRPASVFR